jgi:hypothetical protein
MNMLSPVLKSRKNAWLEAVRKHAEAANARSASVDEYILIREEMVRQDVEDLINGKWNDGKNYTIYAPHHQKEAILRLDEKGFLADIKVLQYDAMTAYAAELGKNLEVIMDFCDYKVGNKVAGEGIKISFTVN